MRIKNWLLLISIACFALISACANRGQLVGGEKDETPPVLLQAIPENESLSITPKEFELFFNENIKLNNINKNLLVSPVLKNKPIITQTAKSIKVKIKDTLQPNTTYTFNFGNAIADSNEGNELSGFTYVFSTGETIDQGKISGSVIDAATGEIPKERENLWAVLYENPTDSSITTKAPKYVTPILEDGSFNFAYLSEGDYKAYIVRDNNFNYFYDLPNESIAFTDSLFTVDTTTQLIPEPFALFATEEPTPRIRKQNKEKNHLVLELNKKASLFQLRDSLNNLDDYTIDYLSDSLRIWYPINAVENQLYIDFNEEPIDTIKLPAFKTEQIDSTLRLNIDAIEQVGENAKPMIKTSQSIAQINAEQIIVLEDSLFVAGGLQLEIDSLNHTNILVKQLLSFGKQYDITFNDSTFVSKYGIYSDSTGISFKTPKLENLGSILLNVSPQENARILQLIRSGQVITERIIEPNSTEQLVFKELASGNYMFKVIVDINNNGRWDTGLLSENRQPEQIINYKDEVQVRANWDIEVNLE